MATTINPPEFFAVETITLKIQNLKTLCDVNGKATPASSAETKIGGLSWRVEVHKLYKEGAKLPKLDLRVFCNEKVKNSLWLAKVQFSTHTRVCDNPHSEMNYNYNYFYGFNHCYWILLDIFAPTDDNIGPVEVKVDVRVVHASLKSLPALDTNLVINRGYGYASYTIPVNKHALAALSSYFRILFFGNWKERECKNHYQIKEDGESFDIEAFRFMVYAAMTMGWTVQESNFLDYTLAVAIVKLAVKYDVTPIVDYCEKYLINTKQYSKMELLGIANKYNLEQLKTHAIDNMSVFDFMENFQSSQEVYAELGKATKELLNTRMCILGMEMSDKVSDIGQKIVKHEVPFLVGRVGRESNENQKIMDSYNELAEIFFGTLKKQPMGRTS